MEAIMKYDKDMIQGLLLAAALVVVLLLLK